MNGKELIARRIARGLKDGYYVNLGIGLPTAITAYVPAGIEVIFQAENGMLGIGPPPPEDQQDPDMVNPGKQPVTALPGASFFGSEVSVAMIRGACGHEHIGRNAGFLSRRSCQLDDPGKNDERYGWSDGSCRWRCSRPGCNGA